MNRWFAAQPVVDVEHGHPLADVCGRDAYRDRIGLIFFVVLRIALGRWRESIFLAVALIGEVTIFVCTTMMIDRARPPVPHLDAAPPTSSFPSGHTGAAVVLYGALAIIAVRVCTRAWLRNLALVLAVVVPICVAAARLYRGMHFPTDVMGGAATRNRLAGHHLGGHPARVEVAGGSDANATEFHSCSPAKGMHGETGGGVQPRQDSGSRGSPARAEAP